ncbi:hypothetical protein RP20_CCG004971 [Aedes albopictus]|nr:hypothetical protein RP20_CCG004971 [Aedes albopictus]
MKFIVVLAMLLAVAFAMPKPENELTEEMVQDLHGVLVDHGVDPEVAHGWLSNAFKKVVGAAGKVVGVAGKVADVAGKIAALG